MNNYIILAFLYIVYCFLHSYLISIPVTRYFKKKMGKYYCHYRLSYNIFSFVTIIPILYFEYSIRGEIVYKWNGLFVYLKYIIQFIGIFLLFAGGRGYSFSQFLGLKQIKYNCQEENDTVSEKLSTSGILKLIRHPWYTAVILLLWSRNLDYTKLIANIVLTTYIIIGTYLEENKLIIAFGNSYKDYQKKVSTFIPFKWLFKRM